MRRWSCLLLIAAMLICLGACAGVTGTDEPLLALDYRAVTLFVGMPADEALGALGEDFELMESESCAGAGMDRMYVYPSLRHYVFAPEKGEARVTSISYTDDREEAATKDVRLGCRAEDVLATFGEPSEQNDLRMVYRRGGAKLSVTLRDGVVTAIVLSEE